MAEPPPPGIGSFLSPDSITGMGIAIAASLIAALQARVKGPGVLISNAAAALLGGAVMPLARSRGYDWGDWLAIIMIGTGIFAGTAFLLIARIAARILHRSDGITDQVIDRFSKDKS